MIEERAPDMKVNATTPKIIRNITKTRSTVVVAE
jgi:hypothetical protein